MLFSTPSIIPILVAYNTAPPLVDVMAAIQPPTTTDETICYLSPNSAKLHLFIQQLPMDDENNTHQISIKEH